MKITLYNVISQDGFVATKDRKEDFIPDKLWESFVEICKQNDVLIWGKNTYEALKEYDQELKDQFFALPIKKVILSRDNDFIPELPFTIIHSVEEVSKLPEENVLVCGSAVLNDLFVKEKMVNKIVTNVLPTVLGEGIPQFATQPEATLVSEIIHEGWVERIHNL